MVALAQLRLANTPWELRSSKASQSKLLQRPAQRHLPCAPVIGLLCTFCPVPTALFSFLTVLDFPLSIIAIVVVVTVA
eukprot:4648422-Amphidinium_carterae.1